MTLPPAGWQAPWAITQIGLQRFLRKKIVIILLFVAWTPALLFGVGFFAMGTIVAERSITQDEQIRSKLVPRPALPIDTVKLFSQLLGRVSTQDIVGKQLEELLPLFWRVSFYQFVWLESWVLLFLALAVGPFLVTPDIRSRSLSLYFSRPVSGLDYALGKAGIIFTLFGMAFLLPSILMYLSSIYFMPTNTYIRLTIYLIPRIFTIYMILSTVSTYVLLAIGSSCKTFWTFTSFLIFITLGVEISISFVNSIISIYPSDIKIANSYNLISICSILNDFNCYLTGINQELSRLNALFRHEWVADPISGQMGRLGDMPLFGSKNPFWQTAAAAFLFAAGSGALFWRNLCRASR